MTRNRVRAGLLAVTALTFLAACGGGGSGSDANVASLGEGASGATTTTAPTGGSTGTGSDAANQQALLDFAKCMRDHGINMPDPQFSADGGGTFTVSGRAAEGAETGAPSDADIAKQDEAQKACQAYLDKVRSSMPPPDPAELEKQKQQLLDFAQCMRDHGIDFPDPQVNTDGGGITVKLGGPGVDADSPGFNAANEACATQTGLPAPGDGGGIAVGTAGGATTGSGGAKP